MKIVLDLAGDERMVLRYCLEVGERYWEDRYNLLKKLAVALIAAELEEAWMARPRPQDGWTDDGVLIVRGVRPEAVAPSR